METLTKIDNIKDLYSQVKKKTQFIINCADDLSKSPNTLRHHWFGQFWSIPADHQDRVIELLQNTINIQNETATN